MRLPNPIDAVEKRLCRREASALIVVLWAILVLAFAIGIAAERIALIVNDASIRAKRLQAEFLADSALASLDGILKAERTKLLDSKRIGDFEKPPLDLARFHGAWRSDPVEFGDGLFWIEVADEQSKIHWLNTPFQVWRNLLDQAGLPSEQIDAWLDALADWQDADDARALNGAETPDYQTLEENKRKAKNAPIADLGELFWIMGGPELMDLKVSAGPDENLARLLPLTTMYGNGKINLNTAPAILLAAVLDVPLESAELVIRARWGPDGIEGTSDDVFLEGVPQGIVLHQTKKPEDSPKNETPSASAITTSSSLFRVRGVGVFQGQKVTREALAARESEFELRLLQEPRTLSEMKHILPADHGF